MAAKMAAMNWISLAESASKTGTSDRTIRRWVEKHKLKETHVRKQGRNVLLNAFELDKDYPFKNKQNQAANDRQRNTENQQTTQMQIVSHSETIKELSRQIERRDEEIKLLLSRKSKLPVWLTIGFIFLSLIIATVTYAAFIKYRAEILQTKERETKAQENYYQEKISLIKGQNNNLLDAKNKTITQQRQELAEKASLISQLYNDIKAQNKKLLELTENLKHEFAKNEQSKNMN